MNSLIEGLNSYTLTENLSIAKASEWMNRKEVLETFGIRGFEQKTLYRVLSILGENREEIMIKLQDRLFETYDFEHTNINMDWTSIVLHGNKCPIANTDAVGIIVLIRTRLLLAFLSFHPLSIYQLE